MSLPVSQIGVFRDEKTFELKELSVPQPGPNEILTRNVAVASNPKDWKHPRRFNDYSYVEGSDVAGEIAIVGEGVADLHVGQRVATFTKMATKQSKYGGYAEFSVAPAATTIPIPDDLSFEEASTLPLAIITAAVGLSSGLGLKTILDTPADIVSKGDQNSEAVIVYGASSSVGAYVVQLAKFAGYAVVGVAGSSSEYAKSLGADTVVDYRNYGDATALGEAILEALGSHPCSVAYDCIGTEVSPVALSYAISKASPGGSGKLTHITALVDGVKEKIPAGVETIHTYIASAFNEDEAFCARFTRKLSTYLTLTNGVRALQPNKVKVMPNGLASVGEGLKLLENNQVHAEKLVYRVAETPK